MLAVPMFSKDQLMLKIRVLTQMACHRGGACLSRLILESILVETPAWLQSYAIVSEPAPLHERSGSETSYATASIVGRLNS